MPRENTSSGADGFDVRKDVALGCFFPVERSVLRYGLIQSFIPNPSVLDGGCREIVAGLKGEAVISDGLFDATIDESADEVIAPPILEADEVALAVGWVIWKGRVNVGHATNVSTFARRAWRLVLFL